MGDSWLIIHYFNINSLVLAQVKQALKNQYLLAKEDPYQFYVPFDSSIVIKCLLMLSRCSQMMFTWAISLTLQSLSGLLFGFSHLEVESQFIICLFWHKCACVVVIRLLKGI